jgi:hypothetical protein
MKYVKTYESWRQVKGWIKIPKLLIEFILSKLVGFIPRLNFIYDQLAAKIDVGKGISYKTMTDNLTKISINDIQNKSLKNSVKVTGLFNNWNIYLGEKVKDPSHTKPNLNDIIYITKDELHLMN